MTQWIIILNWEDYQHRDAARSKVLPWIKNETRLLSSPDYLNLTANRRAILHGLWLEYARSLRRITDNTAMISRRLNLRVTMRDLEALNHAGFIEFSASKPARNPAGGEGEGDRDREFLTKTHNRARANGTQATQRLERLIQNGALYEPLDLEAELASETTLSDDQRNFLRALIPAGATDRIPPELLHDTEPPDQET